MGRMRTGDHAPGHDDLHTDFFEHFETVFGTRGGDYASFEPAYEFGYEFALEDNLQDASYEDAVDWMRREYKQRYPSSDYDYFEPAIRYAFERTRQLY